MTTQDPKIAHVKLHELQFFDGDLELTSRAQAKRVVTEFENFEVVEIDFSSVDGIGQAFADELVRVWPLAHPSTKIRIKNANESVSRMLQHVTCRSDLPQPDTVKIDP